MIANIYNTNVYKIILSCPVKCSEYTRGEVVQGMDMYRASLSTATQVHHKNIPMASMPAFVEEMLSTTFTQYTAWDDNFEYSARMSKKGKLLANRKKAVSPPSKQTFFQKTFNKQKNYIINEGDNIPVLQDIGIFTKENKIAAQMHDKFQQINRFIEIVADETRNLEAATPINIIDFGCGKSYLTFLIYHYFTVVRNMQVNICGLDLNQAVIATCTQAATKYGYTGLTFKLGDIGKQNAPPLASFSAPGSFNIVISLHACDTATDHAIYNAIQWQADLICAAPCCQHELRKQIKPASLSILTSYGIVEERFAALATDAIRAKLLEYMGYKAQILEFTSLAHTAKNLLIRARRAQTPRHNIAALTQATTLCQQFGFSPTLMHLLEI